MIVRTENITAGVTLHLGDCRDFQPTEKIDAVITDPPYGLGELWNGGDAASNGRWKLNDGGSAMGWDSDVSDALPRMIDLGRHAIVWGGNYYKLPPRRGWLIWDKIVREFTSGHVELAWTTIDQPTRAFNYAHAQLAGEGKLHPTQKPVPLMKWCITQLPASTDLIFDPFMGVGSTGVAAVQLGKRFIGIEIDEKYFAIACRRIYEALQQPDMFIDKPTVLKQGRFQV